MATFSADITLKYLTTKDGDTETTTFAQGDEISILETWDQYYLIKDNDDHIYNCPKDKLNP